MIARTVHTFSWNILEGYIIFVWFDFCQPSGEKQ